MGSNSNIGKIVATVSIVAVISMAMTFSFYKAINSWIDEFVIEALIFFRGFGLSLTTDQFWLVLGVMLFIALLIIVDRGR